MKCVDSAHLVVASLVNGLARGSLKLLIDEPAVHLQQRLDLITSPLASRIEDNAVFKVVREEQSHSFDVGAARLIVWIEESSARINLDAEAGISMASSSCLEPLK